MINMKLHMKKDLTPGAAIRYWQLGAIAEDRFDVPDTPMKGEMDPFFFLTQHKNFIPHEYPCRTIFADRYRDKRPDVRGSFDAVRWWLPFGSPRVDLSGLLVPPDTIGHLGAHVCCRGRRRNRDDPSGHLRRRGPLVEWHRNRLDSPLWAQSRGKSEFALPLKAGLNEITIFFDDLAERDARYFFQLDYLEGPRASVAVPVPIRGCRIADAIEDGP